MSRKSKIAIITSYIVLGVMLVIMALICVCISVADKSTEEIFEENILKVVEIKVSDDEESWGYATGCFVDASGTILTNKHVVHNSSTNANYAKIQARLANMSDWLDAEVVDISTTDDLALIKIDESNNQYFRLAAAVSNGQSIYTIGNPNGFGLSFVSGVVSSKERIVKYNDVSINAMQTSFVINEGNSGGPVFNVDGELIGLISFRLKDKYGDPIQGAAFAINIDTIADFI